MFFGMNIPASIRTRLNAISASYAIIIINQNNAFRRFKGCSNRAYLCAGRFRTMIAHFGNKERFKNISIGYCLTESVNTSVRG